MTFLLPGERIDGTAAECAHLRLLLACFRASPPPMRLPEVSGRPLPAVLESGVIDRDQGYRHIQMDAAITVYGDLTGTGRGCPQSAAVDLVRSYAHDCLHYATFRRYRLSDRGEITRVQYGINRRHPDGQAYSAPDGPGDGPTRNLGILMEGATDAEATAIACQAAKAAGITVRGPDAGRSPGGWRPASCTSRS